MLDAFEKPSGSPIEPAPSPTPGPPSPRSLSGLKTEAKKNKNHFLNSAQAAKAVGVSVRQLGRLAEAGKVKPVVFHAAGPGGMNAPGRNFYTWEMIEQLRAKRNEAK